MISMPTRRATSMTRLIFLGVLFAIPFALYAPSLPGPFLFDDQMNIRDNHWVQITDFTWEGLYKAATQGEVPNRPLPKLTYAFNHLAHGLDTPGFHIVNIVFHSLAALALFFLFRTTLLVRDPEGFAGRADLLAFFAALLWAVHPLQSQGVAYIVQRMTSMAALFFFLAVFFYARGRLAETRGRAGFSFAGCAACGALALACKENAVTLPVFLLLYEWFFFQKLSGAWIRRHLVWLFITGSVILLAGLVYTDFSPMSRILASYDFREFTLPQRLYTEPRVVIFYLSLLVFPWPGRQGLMHDFALSNGFLSPATTLASVLFLAALLAVAVVRARKRPILSFAILWLLGNLAMESSFYGLELVFEHRMYLPSAFLFLAGVLFLDRVARNRRAVWAVVLVLALVFSGLTFYRSLLWGDGIAILREAAAKAPSRGRVFHNLALNLLLKGDIEGAREAQKTSIALDEERHNSLMDQAKELAGQGKGDEALRLFRQAYKLRWRITEACNNLGVLLAHAANNPAAAIEFFERAVNTCPLYWQARDNFGMALYNLGRKDEAVLQMKKAVELNPESYQSMNNLGMALGGMGRLGEAMPWFRKSLEVFPSYYTARVNLADAAASDSRPRMAIREYRRVLAEKPDDPVIHYRLARMLYTTRDPEGAVTHLEKTLALDPSQKSAAELLGYVRKFVAVTRQDIERARAKLESDPNELALLQLHRVLVTLYTRVGEDENALVHAQKAVEAGGETPRAENDLGMVLTRLGRYDEALKRFARAAAGEDGNMRRQALYHRAAALALADDAPRALDALRRLFDDGFDQWATLARDADFENIRDLLFFQDNVIRRAAGAAEAEKAGAQAQAQAGE
ncbi:MAG: tetratricopeptide repeat protein [Proteobacteria bacterium]|nr:tetratricopeptide repeat protein [Pseudomonadota bacterium]